MSILSELPKNTKKNGKRLGRGYGSGKGAKSTRGTTRHQRGREHIPLSFEGGQNRLVKRFPLLRGKGKNKSVQDKPTIIRLDTLNEVYKAGDVVSRDTLFEKGVIESASMSVKVVANGAIEKKLTVQLPVSSGAQKLIEAAGGSVELVA
jgi:large subunit ribosomal protein L15